MTGGSVYIDYGNAASRVVVTKCEACKQRIVEDASSLRSHVDATDV